MVQSATGTGGPRLASAFPPRIVLLRLGLPGRLLGLGPEPPPAWYRPPGPWGLGRTLLSPRDTHGVASGKRQLCVPGPRALFVFFRLLSVSQLSRSA